MRLITKCRKNLKPAQYRHLGCLVRYQKTKDNSVPQGTVLSVCTIRSLRFVHTVYVLYDFPSKQLLVCTEGSVFFQTVTEYL